MIAKKLAKEKGISETGYRTSFNTNEHSGQSVFSHSFTSFGRQTFRTNGYTRLYG